MTVIGGTQYRNLAHAHLHPTATSGGVNSRWSITPVQCGSPQSGSMDPDKFVDIESPVKGSPTLPSSKSLREQTRKYIEFRHRSGMGEAAEEGLADKDQCLHMSHGGILVVLDICFELWLKVNGGETPHMGFTDAARAIMGQGMAIIQGFKNRHENDPVQMEPHLASLLEAKLARLNELMLKRATQIALIVQGMFL